MEMTWIESYLKVIPCSTHYQLLDDLTYRTLGIPLMLALDVLNGVLLLEGKRFLIQQYNATSSISNLLYLSALHYS